MFFLLPGQALSEQQGYWELGAGISYLQSPYYLGSDESRNYVVPFPHIIVETEKFSIDRSGVRGHLASSERFELDVSFSGAFKVDSDDSRLRDGMPDLDYILEAGPALRWLLSGRFDGGDAVTLDLPLRAATATDFSSSEYLGLRFTPTLHWRTVHRGQGIWTLDHRLRLMFAQQNFHDYLYSVDTPYVTTQRSAYQADGGFSGWQYRFTLRHQQADRIVGFYLAYSNIRNAVYTDSPLVVEDYNVSGGVLVSWILGRGRF